MITLQDIDRLLNPYTRTPEQIEACSALRVAKAIEEENRKMSNHIIEEFSGFKAVKFEIKQDG